MEDLACMATDYEQGSAHQCEARSVMVVLHVARSEQPHAETRQEVPSQVPPFAATRHPAQQVELRHAQAVS
jgi:hypothetical protein